MEIIEAAEREARFATLEEITGAKELVEENARLRGALRHLAWKAGRPDLADVEAPRQEAQEEDDGQMRMF